LQWLPSALHHRHRPVALCMRVLVAHRVLRPLVSLRPPLPLHLA
jgi:hypothetical protein